MIYNKAQQILQEMQYKEITKYVNTYNELFKILKKEKEEMQYFLFCF